MRKRNIQKIIGTFHICQRDKQSDYKSGKKSIVAACGNCEPAAEDWSSVRDGLFF